MCDKADKLHLCNAPGWLYYFCEGTKASSRIFLGMLRCQLWVLSTVFIVTQVYLCHRKCEKRWVYCFQLDHYDCFYLFFCVWGKLYSLSRNLDIPHPLLMGWIVSHGKLSHCCWDWGSLRTTGIFGSFNYASVNWSKNHTD